MPQLPREFSPEELRKLHREYMQAKNWLDECKHRDAVVYLNLASQLTQAFNVDSRYALVQVWKLILAGKK